MSDSVWPFEHFASYAPARRKPSAFSVFIICPFEPKPWMDSIEQIVREECAGIEQRMRTQVTGPSGRPLEKAIRADRISVPGVIQADIWESIARCDVLVADISRLNANVLYELGTAAARIVKERVILIREEAPEEERVFDLSPIRHFRYTRSIEGIQRLREFLQESLLRALTSALLGEAGKAPPVLPVHFTFQGQDSPWVYSPSECHRLVTAAWLEFGGIDFQQSFLSVADLKLRDVRVQATVRFLNIFHPNPDRAFIGIALRAAHPLANYSNLFYVREDGSACRTVPNFRPPAMYEDEELTAALGTTQTKSTAFTISHEIRGTDQTVSIDGRTRSFDLSSDRIRGEGYILIQAWMCTVGLERLDVEAL